MPAMKALITRDLPSKFLYIISFWILNLKLFNRGGGRGDDQYGSNTNDQFNNNDLEINNENYNNPKVLVSTNQISKLIPYRTLWESWFHLIGVTILMMVLEDLRDLFYY